MKTLFNKLSFDCHDKNFPEIILITKDKSFKLKNIYDDKDIPSIIKNQKNCYILYDNDNPEILNLLINKISFIFNEIGDIILNNEQLNLNANLKDENSNIHDDEFLIQNNLYNFSEERLKELKLNQTNYRSTFNMVLFGMPGSGKSTFTNFILEEKRCRTSMISEGGCSNYITKFLHKDYPIAIYDTPGFENSKEFEYMEKNIDKCLNEANDYYQEIHALIVMIDMRIKRTDFLGLIYNIYKKHKNLKVYFIITKVEDKSQNDMMFNGFRSMIENYFKEKESNIRYEYLENIFPVNLVKNGNNDIQGIDKFFKKIYDDNKENIINLGNEYLDENSIFNLLRNKEFYKKFKEPKDFFNICKKNSDKTLYKYAGINAAGMLWPGLYLQLKHIINKNFVEELCEDYYIKFDDFIIEKNGIKYIKEILIQEQKIKENEKNSSVAGNIASGIGRGFIAICFLPHGMFIPFTGPITFFGALSFGKEIRDEIIEIRKKLGCKDILEGIIKNNNDGIEYLNIIYQKFKGY